MKMEDHESALNPDEFYIFTETIKHSSLALGLTANKNDFGMSNSEKSYRKMIRRHVTAAIDIKKGTVLLPEHLVLKRTSSKDFIYDINSVCGKEILIDLKKDIAIQKKFIK